MTTEKEAPKEKDVAQIVRYLCATFNQVTAHLERPFRGSTTGPNEAYLLQREFAYLLNEVMQGPNCLLQKNIEACNNFIDELVQRFNKQTA